MWILAIRVGAMRDGTNVIEPIDHSLREQKSSGELMVCAGSPHHDRDDAVVYLQL